MFYKSSPNQITSPVISTINSYGILFGWGCASKELYSVPFTMIGSNQYQGYANIKLSDGTLESSFVISNQGYDSFWYSNLDCTETQIAGAQAFWTYGSGAATLRYTF